jgi:hypothetical protein
LVEWKYYPTDDTTRKKQSFWHTFSTLDIKGNDLFQEGSVRGLLL